MSYESPIKYFRDQYKEPDKYKEANPGWTDPEIAGWEKSEKNTEAVVEQLGSAGKAYKNTVETIREAKLKKEFQANLDEQKILDNRKEMIIKYLRTILDDVRNYLNQVNYLQTQKVANYDNLENYQSAISESDGLRRTYHNKMISDLKIAVRLININFNNAFPESSRLEEEKKMIDRKELSDHELMEKMAQREYFDFDYPAGVFIDLSKAPRDPQGEREYIAQWALKIYSDLSALETQLKK